MATFTSVTIIEPATAAHAQLIPIDSDVESRNPVEQTQAVVSHAQPSSQYRKATPEDTETALDEPAVQILPASAAGTVEDSDQSVSRVPGASLDNQLEVESRPASCAPKSGQSARSSPSGIEPGADENDEGCSSTPRNSPNGTVAASDELIELKTPAITANKAVDSEGTPINVNDSDGKKIKTDYRSSLGQFSCQLERLFPEFSPRFLEAARQPPSSNVVEAEENSSETTSEILQADSDQAESDSTPNAQVTRQNHDDSEDDDDDDNDGPGEVTNYSNPMFVPSEPIRGKWICTPNWRRLLTTTVNAYIIWFFRRGRW